MEGFIACFSDLEDPRDDNARHDLHEILLIAFCTMLCGGEDCSDMALFGRAKEPFLQLPHGIPSQDTFSRLFRRLEGDPSPRNGGQDQHRDSVLPALARRSARFALPKSRASIGTGCIGRSMSR